MGAQCCKQEMRREPPNRSIKKSIKEPSTGPLHLSRDTMNSQKTKKSVLGESRISDKSEFFSCISGKDSRRPSTLPHHSEEEEHAQTGHKSHFAAYAQKNEPISERESVHQLEQEQKSPKQNDNENGEILRTDHTDEIKDVTGIPTQNEVIRQENDKIPMINQNVEAKEIDEIINNTQENIEENKQDMTEDDEFYEAKSSFTGNVGFKENSGFETNEEIINQELNQVEVEVEVSQSDNIYVDLDKEELEDSLDKIEQAFNEIQKILADMPGEDKKVFEEIEGTNKLVIYSDYSDCQVSFKAEWKLPCSSETFIKRINCFEGLKGILNTAQVFEELEKVEDETKNKLNTYYICYDGTSEHQSKDCVFIKSHKMLDENKWCDLFKSVAYHGHPEYEGKFRMNISFGGHLAFQEESPEESEKIYKARLYIQFDIKNEDKQAWISSIVEKIKQYVEGCDKAFEIKQ